MLHFLAWWLIIEILGLVALPLSHRLFKNLPDRGYAFAKPLGLLLTGYTLWILVTFGFLRHSWGGITFCILLVAAGSALVGRPYNEVMAFLRRRGQIVFANELLFALAFGLFAFFRAYNPEIAGTEKPMEFAFLNACLRSERFPPHDPWLSGFAISYYYFGYLMMALLAKLSGVPPSVAFNLGIALLFAWTVTGAYGLVYNLVEGAREQGEFTDSSTHRLVPFLGSLFVAVIGNLEGLLEVLHAHGIGSAGFWRWIDIKGLASAPLSNRWHPIDSWWWWRASRVIHDRDILGRDVEVIDEFPFFSFLLGDMHPHVLALPFVLLALALALELLREPRKPPWPRPGLFALCLGGLAFLNMWDFPVYLAVAMMAYALGRYRLRKPLKEALLLGVKFLLLGVLLYLPFYIGFQSQAGGILPVIFAKTKVHQYLIMFGPFIFVIGVFLPMQLRHIPTDATAVKVVIGGALAVMAISALFGRWLPVLLAVLMAMALLALLRRELSSGTQFALLLAFIGLFLTFSVEFVYLKDLFGTRMNTVFKFYYQAWVMLAIASAYGVYRVAGSRLQAAGRWIFLGSFLVLFAAGMVYPVVAGYTKAGDFSGRPSLDGTAYMARQNSQDYAAIRWLNRNVEGVPIILEATGGSYSQYARISAQTGLPTVLGWDFHELQWRGTYEEPGKRKPDIEAIYSTPDAQKALALLEKYDVQYVYVGPLERSRYDPAALAKFEKLMDVAYQQGGVTIYRRSVGACPRYK